MTLTVPRYGPPVSIRARPEVVQLEDETGGSVTVLLDNLASNYPRRIQLAAFDPEAVVNFQFSSPNVEVAAGGNATVELDFTVPSLQGGEARTWQMTISATEGDDTAQATVGSTADRTSASAATTTGTTTATAANTGGRGAAVRIGLTSPVRRHPRAEGRRRHVGVSDHRGGRRLRSSTLRPHAEPATNRRRRWEFKSWPER